MSHRDIDRFGAVFHNHGPGKRWDGTAYTCTDCRQWKARRLALLAAIDAIGRAAYTMGEAMRRNVAVYDELAATLPPPRRYRRIR